jgi:hypothetical protein
MTEETTFSHSTPFFAALTKPDQSLVDNVALYLALRNANIKGTNNEIESDREVLKERVGALAVVSPGVLEKLRVHENDFVKLEGSSNGTANWRTHISKIDELDALLKSEADTLIRRSQETEAAPDPARRIGSSRTSSEIKNTGFLTEGVTPLKR